MTQRFLFPSILKTACRARCRKASIVASFVILIALLLAQSKAIAGGCLHSSGDSIFLSEPGDASSFAMEVFQQGAFVLLPGKPVEREIAGGEAHNYLIALTAGQYLRVAIEQQAIDLVVTLFDSEGKQVVRADSPFGRYGPEVVSVIAETTSDYRVEARSPGKSAPAGRYQAKIEALREATAADKDRITAESLFAEAQQLRSKQTPDTLQKSLEKYEAALPYWRAAADLRAEGTTFYCIGLVYSRLNQPIKLLEAYEQALKFMRAAEDKRAEALILNNTCKIYDDLGEPQKAIEQCDQALALWQALADSRNEALTLNNLGAAYALMGEPQKALERYNQSLTIRRNESDKSGQAAALNNIGAVHNTLGERQKALDYYRQSLSLYRDIKDRRGEAEALNNIGVIYGDLGEIEEAMDYYDQALALWREIGERRKEAYALDNLGFLYLLRDEQRKAMDYYEQALNILRDVADRHGEAITLRDIGHILSLTSEPRKALQYYEQALQLQTDTGERLAEGVTLGGIGKLYALMGEPRKALDYYSQAITILRAAGDRPGEAKMIEGIALIERDRGNFVEAGNQIEAALAIIEALRVQVANQKLRAAYFASKQDAYHFYIDLLMRQHQKQPSKGYDAAALQISERARARILLETLIEAQADIRLGADPSLIERERGLQRQINAKAERQMRLSDSKQSQAQIEAAAKEVEDLMAQYEEVQAQIKIKSPRYAALTQPVPLSLKQIQQQALDADTMLLEYALGEQSSYLWAVTPSSINSFKLPPASDLNTAARRIYEAMTARNLRVKFETVEEKQERVARADTEFFEAASALGRVLLGPVADQLGKKRLLVVAEGALQYVPFGALAVLGQSRQSPPRSEQSTSNLKNQPSLADYRPLLLDHEIVYLPSASVMAVLRREVSGRKLAPKAVAVLADPVFDKNDPRFVQETDAQKSGDQKGADSARQSTTAGFGVARLPFTRQEAEAILSFVPEQDSLRALGFKANRATATSDQLSRYRILHFATHGYLDSQRPELSGIVLSMIDEQGRPQDGFLRLHEVYNLSLPAELVVLSGCRTGLGKEIKGEGLLSLTRGFMYAGAARVVVSLWDVNDAATAELMKRFYEGMLVEKLRPAAALKAAQVAVWKDKLWASPYYWAAFVLQGEWR